MLMRIFIWWIEMHL